MQFFWPWSLLGLAAVGAVAVWTLLRPGRQLAVVSSLKLWQEAMDSLDKAARRGSRRVTASWVALLAGAMAAVLATAGPVYRESLPARLLAVAAYPSAELATEEGMESLRSAVGSLLDRLSGQDRIQLLLPVEAGGAAGWLSPAEARSRLAGIDPLPLKAGEMTLPEPDPSAQQTVRFRAAGDGPGAGPNVSVVELAPALPRMLIEAAGAVELPGGQVQALLSLRPNGRTYGYLGITGCDDRGVTTISAVEVHDATAGPIIRELPAAEWLALELWEGQSRAVGAGAAAYLVRVPAVRKKVAMVGPDEPLLRRFVQVNPAMELVGDAKDADVVIANGQDAPPGKPALVVNPPSSPSGWRRVDREIGPLALADADLAADAPVMKSVDLAGVAVRRAAPWIAAGQASQKRLAAWKGDALILREGPDAGDAAPRRIYVAFDISMANTNFGMTPALVVFLANAADWLCPGGSGKAEYACLTPSQAGRQPDWTPLAGGPPLDIKQRDCALTWPGLYKDPAGGLHAVTLTGLGAPQPPKENEPTVRSIPLPPPRYGSRGLELWPALTVAAMALWLAGWALRVR